MITEDIKKAIQNEVKKQLGILKDKDGNEKKELTPYQKTIELLKNYNHFKNSCLNLLFFYLQNTSLI